MLSKSSDVNKPLSVYGVLLHPLPYPGSDRLVAVLERQPKMTLSVAYPDCEDMRGHVTSFESMAGSQRASYRIGQIPCFAYRSATDLCRYGPGTEMTLSDFGQFIRIIFV